MDLVFLLAVAIVISAITAVFYFNPPAPRAALQRIPLEKDRHRARGRQR